MANKFFANIVNYKDILPIPNSIIKITFLFADSEGVYNRVIGDIARSYGKEYTVDVRIKILGTPEPSTAKIAVEEMQLPITPEQFLEIYKPMCLESLKNPSLMPGTSKSPQNLVSHIHLNFCFRR